VFAALVVALLALPASAQDAAAPAGAAPAPAAAATPPAAPAAPGAAAPPSAEAVARGQELFALCTQCHLKDGSGNQLALAPAIAGLPQWYVTSQLHKFRVGHRGGHFDDIAGMRMRPMSLALASEDDVTALGAYVASLPPVKPQPVLSGGDATRGQALYAPCAACHGPDGSGNEVVLGPPLRTNDWYQLTQLANFRAGVRGTKPGDTTGALMRPMSMTLADEQAMRDVLAYIATLAK
jgi:cytochrome c oxidase subunit 2